MLRVGAWRPDLPDFENPGALEALNVVPGLMSYRPFPSFSAVTSALTARCQGAASFRDPNGTIHNFAGDATKLYKLSADGLTWGDVSRLAGGAYATGADGGWSFTQFGYSVIAVNGVDAPQEFTLGTDANFAALAGSPPVARFCATVRDFVFLCRIVSFNNRAQWSAINDPTNWTTSQTTMADQQDIPEGGYLMGVIGGESALVFQRNAIKRFTFIGPPPIFQVDEISKNIGCMAEGSIAAFERDCFFLSDNGFYHIVGQTEMRRIGVEKVDAYFLADFDQSWPHRIIAAISPQDSLYIVAYPGTGNSGGTPNKLLLYHWPTGRWARAELEAEFLYAAQSQAGYTLDSLDSLSGSVDALPFSLDSFLLTGTGRYGLSGFSTDHKSGFFNGANMAATVDTTEAQLFPNHRAHVRSVRSMVQATSATITVRPVTRNLQSEAVSVGSAVPMNGSGMHPMRVNSRYIRGRIEVAAGGTWEHLIGIDQIEASQAGQR